MQSVQFEDGESVLQLKARIAKLRGFDDSDEVKPCFGRFAAVCYLI